MGHLQRDVIDTVTKHSAYAYGKTVQAVVGVID